MAECDVCRNDYDKAFVIQRGDQTFIFDCFECAIHLMAPRCAHCDCRIIGHGVETETNMYCCAHCATAAGSQRLQDRSSELT